MPTCNHIADPDSVTIEADSPCLYDVTCELCSQGGAFCIVDVVKRGFEPVSHAHAVVLAAKLNLIDW